MSDLYLIHHGIKGQKWGVRRFQNEDGSLTPAGEKRYDVQNAKEYDKTSKRRDKLEQKYMQKGMSQEDAKLQAYKRSRIEKALAITAGVAVASLAAYGVKRYRDANVDRVLNSNVMLKRVDNLGEKSTLSELVSKDNGFKDYRTNNADKWKSAKSKIVNNYRSEHPDTKLTVDEIMKIYLSDYN